MDRGEVWLVSFDPSVDAEIRKTRPAVIISSNTIGLLPLRVIVPITAWQPEFADAIWMVPLIPSSQNGLSKASAVDAFQVKSFATRRLVRRLGCVSSADLDAIIRAVGNVIGHP